MRYLENLRRAGVEPPGFGKETVSDDQGCPHDVLFLFKCENFQKSGAFKVRGAFNAIFSLTPEEAARGIVTSSSGNQAAAVSLAARARGSVAHIAMPRVAVASKVAAVERYGGKIVWVVRGVRRDYGGNSGAQEPARCTPTTTCGTIAGQATCALEILEDLPTSTLLLAPVGGGGLLSGTCLTAAAHSTRVHVIGCESAMADDAQQSLRKGAIVPQRNPQTIADGLRTSLGEHTWRVSWETGVGF